jgi:predicted RNase H-like nuclease (RuvC/YqgF family)
VNYQEALLALRRRVEEGSQARAAVEASLSAERTAREAEIAALRERLAEAQREIEETAAKLASPRFLLGALGQRLGRGLRRP